VEQVFWVELIDDDPVWRESLADYLRQKGFRVQTAATADQGLRLLGGGVFSLVVCDYHLAGDDGLKLVELIRASHLSVNILMVSSTDEGSLPERALAAGAQAFLSKTSSPHTLLHRIRQLTGNHIENASRHGRLQLWQRLLPSPARNNRRASA
jgi:DNA-binding response OmpR family regulator